MTDEPERLLTPAEAAAALGVSRVTVVECVSHRLMRLEGRTRLIAELRGEVARQPPAMPVRAAAAAVVAAAPASPLPESTLPAVRSLWE